MVRFGEQSRGVNRIHHNVPAQRPVDQRVNRFLARGSEEAGRNQHQGALSRPRRQKVNHPIHDIQCVLRLPVRQPPDLIGRPLRLNPLAVAAFTRLVDAFAMAGVTFLNRNLQSVALLPHRDQVSLVFADGRTLVCLGIRAGMRRQPEQRVVQFHAGVGEVNDAPLGRVGRSE